MTLARIACVCGDAGGASAMTPVLTELMKAQRTEVCAFAYLHARQVWTHAHIPFQALDDSLDTATLCAVVGLADAQLLLVGTSVNAQNYERQLIASARTQHIPSLALLDFWSNYRERFDDAVRILRYLPDCIAVMDEYARDQLIASGFDGARLVITGQPAFDALQAKRALLTSGRRQQLRNMWTREAPGRVVLFASQPLSKMPGAAGLDEKKIVAHVLQALEIIATQEHLALTLLIRPHPREETRWMSELRSDKIRVVVSSEGDAHEIVQAVDLVTGINSVLLVEACHLGCVVASIQIGLCGQDVLPTNSAGYTRAIYEEHALAPVLKTMLLDIVTRAEIQTRLMHLHTEPASPRVAQLCYRMLGMTV